jgi:hypothetical protein
MKHLFKIAILMLITSLHLQAQIKEVYNKSFDATNLKTLVLDLEGAYVRIESSEDDSVHFDYRIEFENYSKKEVESILEKVKASANLNGDILEFKGSSSNKISDVSYSIETLFGITFEGDYISFKEPTNKTFRKSKQYFLETNSSSKVKSLKEYLKNIRELDDKGEKRKINTKNVKILRSKFIIKIPEHLALRVIAINSNLEFYTDLKSQLNLNARDTGLKFRSLANPLNTLDVVNGNFRCNALNGGTYKFNHVDEVRIAEVENVTLDSEFATTKIGEIGKNVEIVDFNSEFWIHNFSHNFGDFKMNTEYSEINLFYPEGMDSYIETFGHDTVHYAGNLATEIPPSRKNKASKMMVIGKETSPNKIKINTIHGIIRFGEDFIDVGE